MKQPILLFLLLLASGAWAGIPATPVMTLYQFNGSLDVPYYDVDDLTGVLTKVARMPDKDLERLARAGRQWVEDEFTAVRYMERLLRLYDQLGVR
jgi:hypothetical protein